MLTCGIDEAGKGPVIGPMVIAGVTVDNNDLPKLREIGVKDSKLLSRKQREDMFNRIKRISKEYKIIILNPKEIDSYVVNNKLNDLEGKKMCDIINRLTPDRIFIDCPSPNIRAFREFIKERMLKKNIKLIVEHKADYKYKVVGAASILAKVVRDKEIDKIKKKYNIEFGSGYPSDERTQEFLRKNWNNPKIQKIFRKSWITWRRLKSSDKQIRLSSF